MLHYALLFTVLCFGCENDKPVPKPTVEDKPSEKVPELVKEINSYRATRGLPPLEHDPKLTAAAQKHVDDMVSHGTFSHTGSDGSTFSSRARAAGFPMSGGGEIIAQSSTASEAVGDWKQSSGHHAQMLNTSWKYFGAAVGKNRACAVFGNK